LARRGCYNKEEDVTIKLIAGEVLGHKSPVPVHSPLYFLEIKSKAKTKVSLGNRLFGESALYILEGSITDDGYIYEPKQILVAKDTKLCEFEIEADTTVYIFGGEPFPEERFIYWNFVSSSKERLEQAKEDWKAQRFPKVPGETVQKYPVRRNLFLCLR